MIQRTPRVRDDRYLAYLRTCMCCVCGVFPPCDAAHIRMASEAHGKRYVGLGEKPSDRWAVPLCRSCHSKQHGMSESEFWSKRGLDPFKIAIALYKKGGHPDKPSKKPRSRKIASARGFPKATRKIPSRPFARKGQ